MFIIICLFSFPAMASIIILILTMITCRKSKQCQHIDVYVILAVTVISPIIYYCTHSPSVIICQIKSIYYLYADFVQSLPLLILNALTQTSSLLSNNNSIANHLLVSASRSIFPQFMILMKHRFDSIMPMLEITFGIITYGSNQEVTAGRRVLYNVSPASVRTALPAL